MKKCTGTGYDWDHCRVEKMGCPGCKHYEKKEETNHESKASKCPNNKSDKTD